MQLLPCKSCYKAAVLCRPMDFRTSRCSDFSCGLVYFKCSSSPETFSVQRTWQHVRAVSSLPAGSKHPVQTGHLQPLQKAKSDQFYVVIPSPPHFFFPSHFQLTWPFEAVNRFDQTLLACALSMTEDTDQTIYFGCLPLGVELILCRSL